jgi:phosphate starvation-inducible PhoH-like protein
MARDKGRKRTTDSVTPLLYFEPRTENQALAIETIQNNDLTFLLGSAGCGKTFVAVYAAIKELLMPSAGKRKQIRNIIVTRPIVEAGERLGHLPGEMKEKVHPYMKPVYASVKKLIDDESFIDKYIEIAPLAYMRGDTFEQCTAVLDEAQNCNYWSAYTLYD